MPFFYHKTLERAIVISHMFIKKKDAWPRTEIQRAYDRKKVGEELKPD